MTTLTVFSSGTNDGALDRQGSTYADAQNGVSSDTGTMGASTSLVGQSFVFQYDIATALVEFDTSTIGASSIISAATMSIFLSADQSNTDFTFEARVYDYGASISAADWLSGTALASQTLVANKSTVGGLSTSAYIALADVALATNVNKTTVSRYIWDSNRHVSNTTPTTPENVIVFLGATAGTTNDPKLVVTYTAVPQAPTGLTATNAATAPQVNVAWTAPASGDAPTGYKVDRAAGSSFTTGLVTTDVGLVTSWTDTTTAYSSHYDYRVRGYNAAGDGANSSAAGGLDTPAAPLPKGRPPLRVAVMRAATR